MLASLCRKCSAIHGMDSMVLKPEGYGDPKVFQVPPWVKNLPAMQETQVRSLYLRITCFGDQIPVLLQSLNVLG